MEPRNLIPADLTGAVWKKSSRSGNNGGECVEVASNLGGVVALRDSKDPRGPVLTIAPAEWRTFLGGIKHGRLRSTS
ncbi:DUF397 domain-containing protein [Sphaerisporangium sp. NPDC051017]|uniref:DUF397 domain-containing protein n=1 Tax=Sphaerisporangium sp. NPDC051017 TaxID=3154636 RepID=UPI0034164DAC